MADRLVRERIEELERGLFGRSLTDSEQNEVAEAFRRVWNRSGRPPLPPLHPRPTE
jgi:hypothetical protein